MPRRNKVKIRDDVKSSEKVVSSISYFTLYRFASRWDKFLMAVSVLATFVAAITLPFAISLVAAVFQNMITYTTDSQKGVADNEKFLRSMHAFGINYSAIGLVLFMGGYLGTTLARIAALNQIFKLRQEYLKCALNQDFAYFDVYQTGDFASKMSDDIIKVEEGIGDKVSSFVFNLTIAIGCIIMALIKGWKLALLCLTTAPITFLLVGLTGRIADILGKKGALEKGRASAIAEEVLSSIRTVYAFSGQKKEVERYRIPLSRARRIYIKKDLFTGLSMGCLFLCVFCSYALSFYTGIYLIVNDPLNYNADVMFSVFFGIMTALSYFGMVGSLMATFGSAKGAGAQIFHLLDNVPTISPLDDRGLKPTSCEGILELKNVVFHYPSRPGVPILKGVNMTVRPGQTVALVGHSGCGKSSIIQLISRYYDVLDGNVLLDDIDVRKLSVNWLRSQIGLVGQHPVLFNASIRDNIRYGRDGASDEEVEVAADQAFAHRFIRRLPKGYDTLVGERGAALSGGQKQRIAIARALIRNPKVLLLDEATSALDLSSEAKVQKALDKAAEGRTTVIVAHRLSTIRNADVIYVMKDGSVVEQGNHEELMSLRGHYSEMMALQERREPMPTEDKDLEKEESKISEHSFTSARAGVIESLNEEEKHTPKVTFRQVIRLNAPEWKYITIGCVCSVIIGFSMPVFIVIFGELFGSMSSPDPDELMDKVEFVSVACVIIGLVMGVSNLIEATSFGAAGAYLTERLRVLMFEHLLKQHVAFFDEQRNSTGALCARLSGEAAQVQLATGQRIGVVLQGIGSIGLAVLLAMLFEWRVGLVALSFFPLVAVVIYYQGKATGEESRDNVKTLEDSTMIAIEAVSNVRTVASLGRERQVLSEYAARLQPALAPARRSAHLRGVVAGLSRSMFNFINAAALTYGGHLIVDEGVAYENILITTQSLQMASTQAQNAFTYAPDFQKGITAASRIIASLKCKPLIVDPAKPNSNFDASGEASFKKVEFRYPNRPNVRVLRGLNLHLERGAMVALVGQSGCGKSTVVQLLQRFYDPDSGIVALDKIPLRQLRLSDMRASLGLVSQEPVLFDRTIGENIAYGDNSRTLTRDEIVQAAKQANIHSFVIALPQGYETNIGSKGTQLSGGQKQRVAIARALVRNPKILLLDEATSALDSESEKVVQEALDKGRVGRSCVTIAHRLSTVRDADLICVVSEGRVAESGTHSVLMDRKGLYYKLHNSGIN